MKRRGGEREKVQLRIDKRAAWAIAQAADEQGRTFGEVARDLLEGAVLLASFTAQLEGLPNPPEDWTAPGHWRRSPPE